MSRKRRTGHYRKKYGKEWKRWRLKHKMSMTTLASILGISRRTIYNLEYQVTRPNISTRIKYRELIERYEREQCLRSR